MSNQSHKIKIAPPKKRNYFLKGNPLISYYITEYLKNKILKENYLDN